MSTFDFSGDNINAAPAASPQINPMHVIHVLFDLADPSVREQAGKACLEWLCVIADLKDQQLNSISIAINATGAPGRSHRLATPRAAEECTFRAPTLQALNQKATWLAGTMSSTYLCCILMFFGLTLSIAWGQAIGCTCVQPRSDLSMLIKKRNAYGQSRSSRKSECGGGV
jgi:hypothetical protein